MSDGRHRAGAELGAGGAAAGAGVLTAETWRRPRSCTLIGLAVAAQICGFLAEKKFSDLFFVGRESREQPGLAGRPAVVGSRRDRDRRTLHVTWPPTPRRCDALLKELGYTPYAVGLVTRRS